MPAERLEERKTRGAYRVPQKAQGTFVLSLSRAIQQAHRPEIVRFNEEDLPSLHQRQLTRAAADVQDEGGSPIERKLGAHAERDQARLFGPRNQVQIDPRLRVH